MMTGSCPRLDDIRNYDLLLPKVIPYPQAFYGTVAEFVPRDAESVLELGSGTGILSSFVRKSRPSAQLTCIELDPEAVAIAREKSELAGTIWTESDIRKDWPKGQYDAIVTTQCLFQFSPANRERIGRRAYEALADGGRFLNGDIFHPGNAWEWSLYYDNWRRFMLDSGLSEEEAGAMTGPLEPMIRGYTTAAWSSFLISAGFARATIPFRRGLYAVVAGFRELAP
jgi:tRNA (cmo5U34)-methyltransferase